MSPASPVLPPIVVETARAVHAAMDRRIGPMPKACHAGCSACCHQIVDVLNWEASLVTDFVAQEMPAAQRDRAREQRRRRGCAPSTPSPAQRRRRRRCGPRK